MRSYLVESLSHEVIILLFYNTDCPNPEAVSNGYCNDENNNAECNYDAGDCCGTCVVTEHCSECQCLNGVAGYVSSSLIGDGICHIDFDKSECKYDDGDCCQTPDLVGNGYCNDETNNAHCNYDAGDCCGNCVVTEHCSECQCLNENASYISSNLIGDGICHKELIKKECQYDDWDCCQTPDLVANEICNDETNNGICLFDGGDCCLSSQNTNLCSECGCSTTGVITSPGFPGNYANDLVISWTIQVLSGQVIEIIFVSFDVEQYDEQEPYHSCG